MTDLDRQLSDLCALREIQRMHGHEREFIEYLRTAARIGAELAYVDAEEIVRLHEPRSAAKELRRAADAMRGRAKGK